MRGTGERGGREGREGREGLLVAGPAALALLGLGGASLAALIGVVEAGALEDDAGGVEDALGLVAAAGAADRGVSAHRVLDLEGDAAVGAVIVIACHVSLRKT